ncbi:MAG TPA: NUDIX hydrolase [Candidatus Saccharimonadales bacterium]|nr:NUDIX hydrolase [Candidatus Saccharimonadales bacterium]
MKRVLQGFGRFTFWCAWIAFYVYLKHSERTRVIVTDGQEVLVIKNWVSDGKWSLPGGGLHKNEPPAQGALRELREETGLRPAASKLQPAGTGMYRSYGHTFLFYVFVVRMEKAELKKQWHEVADMQWASLDALHTRNAGHDTLLALSMAREKGLLQ